MTALFISVLLAAVCLECRGQKDNVMQPQGDVTAAEGEAVTLGCWYNSSSSSTSNYLYWYKQEGKSQPIFILNRFKLDQGNTAETFKGRFTSTLDSTSRSAPLKIQELHVSDSAVYYCALRLTVGGGQYKLVFGRGTSLTIQPREHYEPSYYKLEHNNTKACLATGFSRIDDIKNQTLFSSSEAERIHGDSLFNDVVLIDSANEQYCVDSGPDNCEDSLQPDPTVNFVSLTILVLRLLFVKTVVFNVLMTLRLWISP